MSSSTWIIWACLFSRSADRSSWPPPRVPCCCCSTASLLSCFQLSATWLSSSLRIFAETAAWVSWRSGSWPCRTAVLSGSTSDASGSRRGEAELVSLVTRFFCHYRFNQCVVTVLYFIHDKGYPRIKIFCDFLRWREGGGAGGGRVICTSVRVEIQRTLCMRQSLSVSAFINRWEKIRHFLSMFLILLYPWLSNSANCLFDRENMFSEFCVWPYQILDFF